jgi:hypothetical protein
MPIPAKRIEPVMESLLGCGWGRRTRQRGRSSRIRAVGFGIATALMAPTLHAEPFIPSRGDAVLERLPDTLVGRADRGMTRRDPGGGRLSRFPGSGRGTRLALDRAGRGSKAIRARSVEPRSS